MNIVRFDEIDSTNDEAKRRLAAGAIGERTVLVAETQTAGRGTRGRHWISPAGAGLYLSYVDPEPLCRQPEAVLTLAAGVACAIALDSFGLDVRLKPINDLIVNDAKLGGILAETIVRAGRVEAVVIGIGVNLRRAARPVPEGALPPIALEEVCPTVPDAALVEAALLAELPAWIGRVGSDNAAIERAWAARRIDVRT